MDTNYQSYAGECGLEIADSTIGSLDGRTQYDDILKFSNCWRVSVKNTIIMGGKEDNIDCVRGGDYYFSGLGLMALGQNGITIKGGVDGYRIEDVTFWNRGKHCEIEVGQFTKYDKWPFKVSRTTNGVVNDVKMEGDDKEKPVRIRVWNADVPIIRPNSNVKLIVIPKWIWLPYFVFRQLYTKYLAK